MRSFVVKSALALVVLFALTASFIITTKLDASPSEDMDYCSQLWEICSQESEYASKTCAKYGKDSSECQWANYDAAVACQNAYSHCSN